MGKEGTQIQQVIMWVGINSGEKVSINKNKYQVNVKSFSLTVQIPCILQVFH